MYQKVKRNFYIELKSLQRDTTSSLESRSSILIRVENMENEDIPKETFCEEPDILI